ncbi:MAG: hemerythrin family protein [Treponema sp.]|nr:hemerythrin family protein [Treponema sp.]
MEKSPCEVTWDTQLLLDIPLMDTQHEELINMINTLCQICEDSEKSTKSLSLYSQKTISLTNRHFSLEERIMLLLEYPELLEHRREHREFMKRVLGETNKFYSTGLYDPELFIQYLRDWALDHIQTFDKNLSAFISAKLKRA